ncbi:hypothetical protein IMAU30025_01349 [Lactobacillus helveticus]|uniref:Transposase n=1 Tax=Lactobacillus helveticus TaxID=1587 RepID=A0A9Q5C0A4_LACHE|nr:hypothetical protein [Lactobacillus helveticus]NRN94224.1 hypothetical protein [Lactobacillus helveticus]NRO22686.1 hypothetical protein [Lactobacillus helveticus]NRO27030.1 hypothetical protein [Lactobacillus helveticus]NRO35242.1 hypothetical protein [Lactobacillus helveticus]
MPDYPSNISRAQFALIQPDLENFRKHTRPRRYDLYDVFNAILYSLTTGVNGVNYRTISRNGTLSTAITICGEINQTRQLIRY